MDIENVSINEEILRLKQHILEDEYSINNIDIDVADFIVKNYVEDLLTKPRLISEHFKVETSVSYNILKTVLKHCLLNKTMSVQYLMGKLLQFCTVENPHAMVLKVISFVSNNTEYFDINETRYGNIILESRIELSEDISRKVAMYKYLPPMLCPPEEVATNKESGLINDINKEESVLLGDHYRQHNYYLNLDSINYSNQIPMSLNTEFIDNNNMIKGKNNKQTETEFANECFEINAEMQYIRTVGENLFWLRHAYDSRGRKYAKGYRINTQGTPYQKACVVLHNKQVIT